MEIRQKLSKLTLGTAQLGHNYGISNRIGKLSHDNAKRILEVAFTNGITCFDTAPSYGDSEKIIGSYLTSIDKYMHPVIVTKLPKVLLKDKSSYEALLKHIKGFVKASINNLKIKSIPIYLLHHAPDLYLYDRMVFDILLELKMDEYLETLGVSIYTSEEVEKALEIDEISVIQIPINLFDLHLLKSGLLKELKEANKTIFARSIFLQGLLFLDPEKLPKGLEIARKPLKLLNEMTTSLKLSVAELALLFIRDIPYINSILIGAESRDQILENIGIINYSYSLSSNIRNEIEDLFSDLPNSIINPSSWKIT